MLNSLEGSPYRTEGEKRFPSPLLGPIADAMKWTDNNRLAEEKVYTFVKF